MKIKTILKGFLPVFLASVLFAGCNPDKPAGASTITIEQGDITYNSITVKFTPNDNTVSYKTAIGSAGDLSRFEEGTLEGIETVTTAAESERTFTGLSYHTEYTIFAQATNADNVTGETFKIAIFTDYYSYATGEYYGDIGWADNMDLRIFAGVEADGSIVNGYALFFEAFAPNAEDPQNPIVVPGTYYASEGYMPDEFEFGTGFDDGTGNIRSSQYATYVNGVKSVKAIAEGSYTVSLQDGIYTVSVDVKTDDNAEIKLEYVGPIEIVDESGM